MSRLRFNLLLTFLLTLVWLAGISCLWTSAHGLYSWTAAMENSRTYPVHVHYGMIEWCEVYYGRAYETDWVPEVPPMPGKHAPDEVVAVIWKPRGLAIALALTLMSAAVLVVVCVRRVPAQKPAGCPGMAVPRR